MQAKMQSGKLLAMRKPRIDPNFCNYKLAIHRSRIHNLGVFAQESIPSGKRVIEYTGEKIGRLKFDQRSKGDHVYCFMLDSYHYVDGESGGSGAEIINHSCDPNLRSKIINGRIFYKSVRKIKSGEELTVDYKIGKNKTRIPCNCGSKNCRGTINLLE